MKLLLGKLPGAFSTVEAANICTNILGLSKNSGIVFSGNTDKSILYQQFVIACITKSTVKRIVKNKVSEIRSYLKMCLDALYPFTKVYNRRGGIEHHSTLFTRFHVEEKREGSKFKINDVEIQHLSFEQFEHGEEIPKYLIFTFLAKAGSTFKQQYGVLENPSDYKLVYQLDSTNNYSMDFTHLNAIFKNLGMKTQEIDSIFNIISSCLLLGNLEFGKGSTLLNSENNTVIFKNLTSRLQFECPDNDLQYNMIRQYLLNNQGMNSQKKRNLLIDILFNLVVKFIISKINDKIRSIMASELYTNKVYRTITMIELPDVCITKNIYFLVGKE